MTRKRFHNHKGWVGIFSSFFIATVARHLQEIMCSAERCAGWCGIKSWRFVSRCYMHDKPSLTSVKVNVLWTLSETPEWHMMKFSHVAGKRRGKTTTRELFGISSLLFFLHSARHFTKEMLTFIITASLHLSQDSRLQYWNTLQRTAPKCVDIRASLIHFGCDFHHIFGPMLRGFAPFQPAEHPWSADHWSRPFTPNLLKQHLQIFG